MGHQWKDGSTSLKKVSNMKGPFPVEEVSEYAQMNGFSDETAFVCKGILYSLP